MTYKTTAFFNRNCHDYGAQDEALRPPEHRAGQRGN